MSALLPPGQLVRTHNMDPVASALDLAALADQAAASLYRLCEKWSDTPNSVLELMDDLERAGAFLYVEISVSKKSSVTDR